MIFKLLINKDCPEEIVATVHQRTPLIDEIERLATQDITDQIPGFLDDEITMLDLKNIDCFFANDDRTFAVYADRKHYLIKKRLYELEQMLPGEYERISKSAIANRKKIVKFKVQLSGAVDAVFTTGYTEGISRRCFADIKRRFGL